MNGRYVGYVAGHDPLHDFLSRILRDRMGVCEPQPAFRVFRLSGSNEVYAYEEKFSRAKVSCKFYGSRFGWDQDKAAWMARQEFEGLETLRRYNLIGSPHHVIRPLGMSRDINSVLALEYDSGEEFSHAIARATQHGDDAHLYWRLKALAYYLATQHNRTANGATVDLLPTAGTSTQSSVGSRKPSASNSGTSTSSHGCATAGGTDPGCGRTGRSGYTATRLRRTFCSVMAWTSRPSIWNG
jgi:hypothetical protein